jgi:hypothetical protein
MKIPKIDTKLFELYLDIDGVLADFDGQFYKMTGKYPHQVDKKQLWMVVNSVDDYFARLDLMYEAEYLWEYCKQYNPKFLTGLPSKQGGKEQKIGWVIEKFGTEYETIVVPKRDKQLYSGVDKVLVDDTLVNIEQWASKGGIGILHSDVWETIDKLEKLRLGYGSAKQSGEYLENEN